MAKKIEFDLEARDGIKRGVDALANACQVDVIEIIDFVA